MRLPTTRRPRTSFLPPLARGYNTTAPRGRTRRAGEADNAGEDLQVCELAWDKAKLGKIGRQEMDPVYMGDAHLAGDEARKEVRWNRRDG